MKKVKLNICPGDKYKDEEHTYKYWGKSVVKEKGNYIRNWVFFDERGECHEFGVEKTLSLERLGK